MKIGILTFHRCINYGSYWQARCLSEGLQSAGHNVEILDHRSARVDFSEWKCALQPVLPARVPSSDRPLYRKKIGKFLKEIGLLRLSKPFRIDEPSSMDEYDAVIVGSDEVWNLFHPWYGKFDLFFGAGIRSERLISYAASFGNYDASFGLGKEYVEKLGNFNMISVRDENSRTIVRNSIGFDPEMVLDPCLLFPVNFEERESPGIKGPYAIVYGHNFSESFICQIRKWARYMNFSLVSVGYRNDWADQQWIDADPHEFASVMSRTDSVVTNFFHGCIFAMNNSKPFVCEISPYRSIKVRDLMRKVDGEQHLMSEESPQSLYHARLTEAPSGEIFAKTDILRKESGLFLQKALSNKIFTPDEKFV